MDFDRIEPLSKDVAGEVTYRVNLDTAGANMSLSQLQNQLDTIMGRATTQLMTAKMSFPLGMSQQAQHQVEKLQGSQPNMIQQIDTSAGPRSAQVHNSFNPGFTGFGDSIYADMPEDMPQLQQALPMIAYPQGSYAPVVIPKQSRINKLAWGEKVPESMHYGEYLQAQESTTMQGMAGAVGAVPEAVGFAAWEVGAGVGTALAGPVGGIIGGAAAGMGSTALMRTLLRPLSDAAKELGIAATSLKQSSFRYATPETTGRLTGGFTEAESLNMGREIRMTGAETTMGFERTMGMFRLAEMEELFSGLSPQQVSDKFNKVVKDAMQIAKTMKISVEEAIREMPTLEVGGNPLDRARNIAAQASYGGFTPAEMLSYQKLGQEMVRGTGLEPMFGQDVMGRSVVQYGQDIGVSVGKATVDFAANVMPTILAAVVDKSESGKFTINEDRLRQAISGDMNFETIQNAYQLFTPQDQRLLRTQAPGLMNDAGAEQVIAMRDAYVMSAIETTMRRERIEFTPENIKAVGIEQVMKNFQMGQPAAEIFLTDMFERADTKALEQRELLLQIEDEMRPLGIFEKANKSWNESWVDMGNEVSRRFETPSRPGSSRGVYAEVGLPDTEQRYEMSRRIVQRGGLSSPPIEVERATAAQRESAITDNAVRDRYESSLMELEVRKFASSELVSDIAKQGGVEKFVESWKDRWTKVNQTSRIQVSGFMEKADKTGYGGIVRAIINTDDTEAMASVLREDLGDLGISIAPTEDIKEAAGAAILRDHTTRMAYQEELSAMIDKSSKGGVGMARFKGWLKGKLAPEEVFGTVDRQRLVRDAQEGGLMELEAKLQGSPEVGKAVLEAWKQVGIKYENRTSITEREFAEIYRDVAKGADFTSKADEDLYTRLTMDTFKKEMEGGKFGTKRISAMTDVFEDVLGGITEEGLFLVTQGKLATEGTRMSKMKGERGTLGSAMLSAATQKTVGSAMDRFKKEMTDIEDKDLIKLMKGEDEWTRKMISGGVLARRSGIEDIIESEKFVGALESSSDAAAAMLAERFGSKAGAKQFVSDLTGAIPKEQIIEMRANKQLGQLAETFAASVGLGIKDGKAVAPTAQGAADITASTTFSREMQSMAEHTKKLTESESKLNATMTDMISQMKNQTKALEDNTAVIKKGR